MSPIDISIKASLNSFEKDYINGNDISNESYEKIGVLYTEIQNNKNNVNFLKSLSEKIISVNKEKYSENAKYMLNIYVCNALGIAYNESDSNEQIVRNISSSVQTMLGEKGLPKAPAAAIPKTEAPKAAPNKMSASRLAFLNSEAAPVATSSTAKTAPKKFSGKRLSFLQKSEDKGEKNLNATQRELKNLTIGVNVKNRTEAYARLAGIPTKLQAAADKKLEEIGNQVEKSFKSGLSELGQEKLLGTHHSIAVQVQKDVDARKEMAAKKLEELRKLPNADEVISKLKESDLTGIPKGMSIEKYVALAYLFLQTDKAMAIIMETEKNKLEDLKKYEHAIPDSNLEKYHEAHAIAEKFNHCPELRDALGEIEKIKTLVGDCDFQNAGKIIREKEIWFEYYSKQFAFLVIAGNFEDEPDIHEPLIAEVQKVERALNLNNQTCEPAVKEYIQNGQVYPTIVEDFIETLDALAKSMNRTFSELNTTPAPDWVQKQLDK